MRDSDSLVPGEVGEPFLCLARFPKNLGWLANPSGKGAAVGKCGDFIEVSLYIESGAIADIMVFPRWRVFTLVCPSAMSELAKGRDLDRARSSKLHNVADALGACQKTTCTAPAWR